MASQSKPTLEDLRRRVMQGRAPRSIFTRFAQGVAHYAGQPATFVGAVGVIAIWGLTGPMFGYNDTWQLMINTSTTIITFLMVFVIQNAQNRDTAALQIKLDELISSLDGPRRTLLDLEDLDEETLECMRLEFALMADEARKTRDGGAGASPAGPTPAKE